MLRHQARWTAKLKNHENRKLTLIQVKNVEYWKIAALIGTILFAISVFLPIWSAFGTSQNLLDVYQNLGNVDWGSFFANYAISATGLLLMVILWPISLVLCIASIFRRKITLAAGAIGILCWIGAMMWIAGSSSGLTYSAAIYVGFAGAIIVAATHFMKPSSAPPQTATPPAPPQSTPSR